MRNCVLVVERDPSVSRFMQLKLEEEGFSCLVDNIGDSVVDLAGQRQVDIIVLDPDDPMEDGDKILENVREISTIPIIYLSSNCLLYTSPSPRDLSTSRMPSSA